MDKKLYIPFTKRDEDKRIVEGFASTEALDSQGEVVRLDAIEKALPDYMKYANIREMHQWSAVGKTVSANVDRVKKGLYIAGKIVDDTAWKKIKAKVYNGFSIGGKITKRTGNKIQEMVLNEISIVDRPANPEAVFAMVKIDKEGKVKNMQKMPGVMVPEIQHEEVIYASAIMDLARNLRMLLNEFAATGRSTLELEKALTLLKKLAKKVLSEQDKNKFEKILYEIGFEELEMLKPMAKVEVKKKEVIKKHVNVNWAPGYFEDARKVLG